MLLLALTLLSASQPCVEVRQQCRACPTDAGAQRCSSVGIACQPIRRVCEPAATDRVVSDVRQERRPRGPIAR